MDWEEGWHKPLSYVFEVLFWCDMLFSFLTGFIEENGEIRMSPRAIAIHYLRFWFIIDLVANIPYEAFSGTDASAKTARKSIKVWKLLKIPKLLRLGRLLR